MAPSHYKREVDKMKQHKVMRVIKRNQMEPGRKCIKYKWIFDIKRDGTFKARLVAFGYSQVPGIDFQESFNSPVINDVVFPIILIFQIAFKLDSILLDVEVAFLNG
jgi:Reverse transcriptase (RNA-dependent DNA polymerase)